MSYHSDTLAFKKVELLAVLQAIDSDFSFNIASSYKNTFFKHDVFDGFEVACLISGYDPNKLTINLTRSTTWRKENPKFVEALNLVMSVDIEKSGFWQQCDANFYECEHTIKNEDLKTYLASKNIFIDGFNDNLSVQEPIGFDQPSIQQTEPNIESLNAEISRLRKEIEDRDKTAIKLQNRIKELEAGQANEQVEIQTSERESKLSTREENNIIKVLTVLADMDAKIDISKPYEAHGIMARKAQLLGIEPFPSDESIKKWLSKANEYKNPN